MPDPNAIRIISVIAFIILFFGGLKRPVYGVGAYMILVYCKLSSYYPVFGSIRSEIVFGIIILLRLLAASNIKNKLSLKSNPINKYLIYFILCVCLSFLIAWDHRYSWDNAVYHFIKVLLLYVMIIAAVDSIKDLKLFTILFLAMMAYLAYEPFYYFASGTGGSQHLYGTNYIAEVGILSGHVALANNMNQMIPIAFFLIFTTKKNTRKLLYGAFLSIFTAALVGSGSRGGAVGFLFFIIILFIIFFRENKKAAVAALCIGVLFVVSSTAFMHTISRVGSDSAQGRFIGLTHGIGMLLRGNVVGVGPGCYLIARSNYFSYRMESHNIYGQVLGDLGIPGTIAWFFFVRQIIYNLKPALKKKIDKGRQDQRYLKYLAIGLLVSIIVRLFISMGSHGLYYFYWYVVAAMSFKIALFRERLQIDNIKEQR
jgi:O-antigen ligase